MAKIGLLGGTFDPIHIGHLLLGQWAQESFDLDEVWFLPAGNPYFKEGRKIAGEKERFFMTELAVSGNETWKACDVELYRGGKTYTFETLEILKKRFPGNDFYFIFGADCLDSLERWREPERILADCQIIAATRGSDGNAESRMRKKAKELMERFGGKIYVMNFPAMDISSTLIRDRIRKQKPVRILVPEAVERFIAEHELYL